MTSTFWGWICSLYSLEYTSHFLGFFNLYCVFCVHSLLSLCDLMDCSPPGPSAHEIFQTRILNRSAISYSGIFPTQGLTHIPCIFCTGNGFFTTGATWKAFLGGGGGGVSNNFLTLYLYFEWMYRLDSLVFSEEQFLVLARSLLNWSKIPFSLRWWQQLKSFLWSFFIVSVPWSFYCTCLA